MFGASTLEGHHLTHAVPNVSSVDLVRDDEGRDQVLRLAHAGGQTLVLLE